MDQMHATRVHALTQEQLLPAVHLQRPRAPHAADVVVHHVDRHAKVQQPQQQVVSVRVPLARLNHVDPTEHHLVRAGPWTHSGPISYAAHVQLQEPQLP
jgi:hypothetical protein